MKNLSRVLLAASVALTLGACGSTSNTSSSEYASNDYGDDDGMVCKLEKKIGSNRMQRVCYSVEEREQMQEAAREGWTRMQGRNATSGADQ